MIVGVNYEQAKEGLAQGLSADVRSRIIFAGYQEDIAAALEAMDLFVHPSVEDADPWVVSEAMARGRPIVATRIGGIPEKIQDRRCGLLVPAGDPRALAEACSYYYAHPDMRQAHGRAARERVQKDFSIDVMISRHEQLYSE
jgi:glycosyltransferase involved in cell wall biosynthesis